MPGIDGLDLQRRLIDDRHSMPIIFVTAFPNENYRQRALSAGAIGFLSFDEAAFIGCLKTALSISDKPERV